jgi:hypothetical protein
MSKPIVVRFISDSSLSVKWLSLFHFGTSRCRWEGEESIPLSYWKSTHGDGLDARLCKNVSPSAGNPVKYALRLIFPGG